KTLNATIAQLVHGNALRSYIINVMIAHNGRISIAGIAKLMFRSREAIAKHIRMLEAMRVIQHVGTRRKGYWRVAPLNQAQLNQLMGFRLNWPSGSMSCDSNHTQREYMKTPRKYTITSRKHTNRPRKYTKRRRKYTTLPREHTTPITTIFSPYRMAISQLRHLLTSKTPREYHEIFPKSTLLPFPTPNFYGRELESGCLALLKTIS
ncbi:MAG: hypothetical protein II592_08815, partial [Muribaculaceae bacterium]|nr:hypothetical protein [Muribaculaceae bacterium]